MPKQTPLFDVFPFSHHVFVGLVQQHIVCVSRHKWLFMHIHDLFEAVKKQNNKLLLMSQQNLNLVFQVV